MLGVSPYKTPLALYAEKLGLVPPDPENQAMRRGTRREPIILADYADDQGIGEIETQRFVRHPEHDFITATLDGVRVIDGVEIPVEVKHVGKDPPTIGAPRGTLSRRFICHRSINKLHASTRPTLTSRPRSRANMPYSTSTATTKFIAPMIEMEAEFWDRVQTRRPPEMTEVADLRIRAVIDPTPEGETGLDDDARQLVDNYQECSEFIKEYESKRESLKLAIWRALGSAKTGRLIDGRKVTRSVVKVAARVQQVAAHTQTRLTISKAKG